MAIKLTAAQAAAMGINTNEETVSATSADSAITYATSSIQARDIVDPDNLDLSLAGLDQRLRALHTVASTGKFADLDDVPIATATTDGIMSKEKMQKLDGLEKHPNLGPNNLGNATFPNFTHHVNEIKDLQTIARTGLLSDLPGNQIASATQPGLMSTDAYSRLYNLSAAAVSGKYADLIFDGDYKQNLNTTTYIATNEKDGFMSASDKGTFDRFFNGLADYRYNFTHKMGDGYRHLPPGGSAGQVCTAGGSGTGIWTTPVTYNAGQCISFAGDEYSKIINVNVGTSANSVAVGNHNHDTRYPQLQSNTTDQWIDFNSPNSAWGSVGVNHRGTYLYSNNNAADCYLSLDGDSLTLTSPNNGWASKIYDAGNLLPATQSNTGLMSSSDKQKLDSIAWNATAYSHPSTHPASMITGLAVVATSGSYNDLSNKPTWINNSGSADGIKINGTNRTATFSNGVLAFS